uniref:TonB-dependent receptor family protein n=1 Tax=Gelidibacter sp. TaxID=2018083 RepID=UPI00404AB9C5
MRKNFSLILIVLSLFVVPTAFAQTESDTTKLSEVTLYATNTTYQNSPSSVSVISAKELSQTDGVILTNNLNKIPGVTMQQGTLNTNRITIRGIGARSQFSTNRVKAYFDNIPLTNGEGETTIEDIDMETLGGLTILKGSNNSQYGSGLGGVILLTSKEESNQSSFAKTATLLGSFELWKQTLAIGISNERSSLNVSYNHLQNEGFRANSRYNRHSVNITGKHQLNEKSTLSFIGIFTKLKAFIPSSINETDFLNNPEIAATNWAEAEGFESYDKVLLGLNYDVKFSSKLTLSTSVFGTYKNAYEPRPFDILEDNTNTFGLRSVMNYQSKFLSFPTKWTVGGELLTEDYTFSLIENLYQTQPSNGSIEGNAFAKTNQKRQYISLFLEQTTEINSKLFIEAGLSFNQTNYSLKDVFETASNANRQDYSFDNVLSPRLGLSYKIAPNQNLFAAISKGFSIPSVAETLTPEGQINTELKPESGWNYEIGYKAFLFQNKLSTEVTLYSTQIRNLLVARRIAEDQFVGINAGESSHKGIELFVKYRANINKYIEMTPYFTGSFNHFRFKDFVDDDNDYSGNKLTGAPNYQWQTGVDLQSTFGWALNVSMLNMGKMPLNDANSLFSSSYAVTNINTTYQFALLKDLTAELSAGINNVFDKNYAASILPNAVGFGAALPRFYYPGNPLNVYGGVSLVYGF